MISDKPETQRERRARQRAEERAESKFRSAHNAQTSFGAQLRHLARHIGRIIEAIREEEKPPYSIATIMRIRDALADYSRVITPWARATTARMLLEVNRRNKTAWSAYANEMSLALGKEIREADTGATMRALLDEQVPLITSLPLEAAQRVHEKTLEGMELGARYPERTAEIEEALSATNPAATETWVRTRARLIARTETARTASVLTEARAEAIGAEQYVWKTAGDWKVRSSHKKLNGKVFSWDDPPLSDPPDLHSHPGQIFNCRCVALPIIPGV